MRAELHHNDRQRWTVADLSKTEDVVAISCLGLQLNLGQIYEGIELPVGVAEDSEEYEDDRPLIYMS